MEKGGTRRRQEILRLMSSSRKPLSGTWLAGHFSVSRQVIVQDIALIRASGNEIISTNRGYVLKSPLRVTETVKCYHSDEQITDELYTVADLGGTVEDVFVDHKVYGRLRARLDVSSRRDADLFVENIRSGDSTPLKSVTSGYHYHTISADSRETLELIREALKKKGFLCES